jgi:acetamidase/formamidase
LRCWLPAAAGITGPEAYALASMAVSFRVTQYANQTGSAYTSTPPKAVHAVIPKSVFPAELQDRVARWLRP